MEIGGLHSQLNGNWRSKLRFRTFAERGWNATENWYVYHKGVNGGTNPGDYMLYLNTNTLKIDHDQAWNNSLPTSTHFILGNDTAVNSGGTTQYIAMLFASVDGISKVGSYTGDGSANLTITTGFQPRFLLIKRADGNGSWHVFDSVRGMGSTDKLLQLNSNAAQLDVDYVTVSSTGWNTEGTSLTNGDHIYYAHA